MKAILISSILLVYSFCAKAQNKESITIGKKETIFSKVLNESRTIWVYSPNFTSISPDSNKRFPVLYLLDGNAHFYSTVGIIQQLSQGNGNGVLPEMIVVAIENTNRLKDLVPSTDLDKSNPFVGFLKDELIPYVDNHYNTSPYKLIVGHSLGGLTVIDILTHSNELFNAYLAIDPSMWYNNEVYLKNAMAQLPKQNKKGKKLFIGTANTMPKGMTLAQLKKSNGNETQHIRSILKLNDFLVKSNNGLRFAQKYYENERHNTVPLLCEYDGLRFIFDYYFFDAGEKDFADSSAQIAIQLKSHYENVSKELGYKNAPPEPLINYLGYGALVQKHFAKAKAFFELNIEWYPESSKVYDAYADYHLSRKDTISAIANYKKALQINNDASILQKINTLSHSDTKSLSVEDLQKYVGTYTLVDFQLDISLIIRDGSIWAIVPGQADDEFQILSENIFTIKGKQNYKITFKMDGIKPESFTSVQPNGTFKAVFKNK